MKNFTKHLFAFALSLAIGTASYAQLSKGGTPYSFATAVQAKSAIQTKVLTKPDMTIVSQEDHINSMNTTRPYRIGIVTPVNYTVANSGTWETTPDGGSMWRLKIHMDDAKAIGLYYSDFHIPAGGKVFLYNEYGNQVIGAFTADYNYQDQIRATQMIQGSTVTIEYYAPAGTPQTPIINMNEVSYFYRGVEDFVGPYIEDATGNYPATTKAASCQVDVVCTPESNGWNDQINAVVHYVFTQGASSYVCSGSMINNTSQDCTPYIISAWHCGEPAAGSNISSWVWYWNYQKTTCSTGGANGSDPSKGTNTMTGGTVRASSGSGTLNNPPGANQVAGTDFYLVELSSQPPTSYNAYYQGWDRTNTASTNGVGIHHPAGSAKKISTYNGAAFSSSFNGGVPNGHWGVTWSATANGNGVTEGGSSGSPLYNQNKRFVGQLSGGGSACTVGGAGPGTGPSQSDVYGKMFYDWDQNGTTANAQLKPWLDPGNTGATVMDGSYQPCSSSNPPTCGINASATSIVAGGNVTFSDASTGVPTSWAWNFDNTSIGGATPPTSTVQNPGSVTFSNIGTYEVQLIAANAFGTCTTTVNINVSASLGCDTLLNIHDTNSLTIYGASNGGFITGVNGYGDLAKVEKYTGYSPYTHITASDVYFYGVQDGGNGSVVKLVAYSDNTGLPGTILGEASFSLSAISTALAGNGGAGILNLGFDAPINVGGADFYVGLDFSGMGAGDTLGIVSKYASVAVPPNSGYEQWSDGTWSDMETAWGSPFSMYITAHMTDNPITGSTTPSTATGCVGLPVAVAASGTNVIGQTWYSAGTIADNTAASTTITFATAGTYTSYVVLDGGGCSGSYLDSVVITVTDPPVVSSTPTSPSCAGNDGSLTIAATGGSTPYTYSIDNGTTFQSSGNFTGLQAGVYNVVVQDANGCQGTDVVTIVAGSGSLTVSATSTDPSCSANDGTITITATGGAMPYSYSINGGSTFQSSNTFTGLGVNTYSIVVQDNGGCQGTTSVVLTTPGGPTASGTSTSTSCNGMSDGTITILATGGQSPYTYSADGTSYVSSNTLTGFAAGLHLVYVKDANGCTGTTTVTVIEPTAVMHTATVTDATCGQSNGSIVVTATGGTPNYTYSLNSGSSQSTGSFTGLSAGSYTVQVTDGNLCVSTITTHTVAGGSVPTISTNVIQETCSAANGSITVTANGGSPNYQYSNDGGNNYQSSNIFSNLSAGSFPIMVQDAAGCTANTTTVLTNSGGFTLVMSPASGTATICAGNSTVLVASGGTSYTWTPGGMTTGSISVSPTTTTTYTVVASDAQGCQETGIVVVTVDTPPTVTVSPSSATICSGESVTLTATGANTYSWNTGATTPSITVSPTNVNNTYAVTGQNGSCAGNPATVSVTVDAAPTVNANADVTTVGVGGTVNFNTSGSTASGYTWNFGDGQSSTQGFVSHTYNVGGTYTVVLTGTMGNCTDTDTLTITVGAIGIDEVSLENSITIYPNPNRGTFNLKLDLGTTQDVEVKLYSTIGQLIDTKVLNNVDATVIDFNVSNEAEGFYFLKVKTENGTVTKRFTISK